MKKSKRAVFVIIIAFFALAFLFCAYKALSTLHAYSVAGQTYEDLSSKYTSVVAPTTASPADTPESPSNFHISTGTTQSTETSPIAVDFAALTEVNPEVVGWIWSEDTVIDYPVLRGSDNNKYLHTLWDGRYNDSGSIFADYKNSPDFSDSNTILYGHRMNNGSMFASITQYCSQEYYEAHPSFYLNTPAQNYRIAVFSAFTAPVNADVYRIKFYSEDDHQSFLNAVCAQSDIDTDVFVSPADRIVTLSTCTVDDPYERYVVCGLLIPIN